MEIKMKDHVEHMFGATIIPYEDYERIDIGIENLGVNPESFDQFSTLMVLALSQLFFHGGETNV